MPSTEDSSAFSRPFSRPRPNCSPRPPCCPISPKGICSCPRWRTISCRAACWLPSSFSPPRSEKGFFGLVEERLGKPAAKIAYGAYALYFAFSALSPLLDFERFVYTAFFDTAPSMCIFCTFFLFSGFVCVKGARSFGRSADLAMPLFLVSFAGLFILSAGTADFSNLLPLFGTPISSSAAGFKETLGHFSDTRTFPSPSGRLSL